MKTFTASLLRIGFIDSKIRDGAYPTTVSISTDLKNAYGDTVDPRTIAADIASLRQNFKAPIAYDFQHRGYRYTDPDFMLNLGNTGDAVPLPSFISGDSTKTAYIPEWQQELLTTVLDKCIPASHPAKSGLHQISILTDSANPTDTGRNEEIILQALHENKALSITRETDSLNVFFPLHIICYKKNNSLLVFGAVPLPTETRYELFPIHSIASLELLQETFQPPEHITVQTRNKNDIEVITSTKNKDIFLIYTVQKDTHCKLLAKTEIFL
jgi:predicted DNA-binding transcriptional regulator YafY